MNKMSKISKTFVIASLSLSWLLTLVLYIAGILEESVPYIMLVPLAVAFLTRIISRGISKEIYRNPDAKGFIPFLKALIFALFMPIAIVSACAFLGAFLYGQSVNKQFVDGLYNGSLILFVLQQAFLTQSVLFALGEEYGWRAFLLPELAKTYGKVRASTIVGIVWALYHIPVMVLLNAEEAGMLQALALALIQGSAAFVFSYLFSYCYFLSNRVLPAVAMHSLWNLYNPLILGSIYKGSAGLVLHKGPIYMTNGEGILGIVFAGIAAAVLISAMRKGASKKAAAPVA